MRYFILEKNSVGERPTPRSETTRPDDRKITIGLQTL